MLYAIIPLRLSFENNVKRQTLLKAFDASIKPIKTEKFYVTNATVCFEELCDGKICMLLPFVNLGFVSSCISNECLPIQLGMLTYNRKSVFISLSLCLCLVECACVLLTPTERCQGLFLYPLWGELRRQRVPTDRAVHKLISVFSFTSELYFPV